MYSPCHIYSLASSCPVLGLFSPSVFSITYTLSTTIISISLSLHLVLLAPINSCELHNHYLVLCFLLMYSSSGLSTDVFHNKMNINKHLFLIIVCYTIVRF